MAERTIVISLPKNRYQSTAEPQKEVVVKEEPVEEKPLEEEPITAEEKKEAEIEEIKSAIIPIEKHCGRVHYNPWAEDSKPDGERWSVNVDGKWYLFRNQQSAVHFARLCAEDRGVDVAVHAPKKVD